MCLEDRGLLSNYLRIIKLQGFTWRTAVRKFSWAFPGTDTLPANPPAPLPSISRASRGGAEHGEGEKHDRAEPPPSLTPIFCCEHVFLLVFPCREMGNRVARATFSPNTATTEGSGQGCSLKLTPEAETSTTREPKAASRSLLHVSSLSFPLFL